MALCSRPCERTPLYELSKEFVSIPATIIDRTTFGKWDTETGRALGNPDAIVLAGVTTDCCVLSTALAAADAGVHVTVAADACAGVTETDHRAPRRHGALQANDRRRPGGYHPGIRGQMSTAVDRAKGALYGLAIGDALGMPTQLMSHEEVAACFGVLDGFREPPADHLIAAGLPAGSITDDTEQALLLADLCSRAVAISMAKISPVDCSIGRSERGNADRWICWAFQQCGSGGPGFGWPTGRGGALRSDEWGGNADRSCRIDHLHR